MTTPNLLPPPVRPKSWLQRHLVAVILLAGLILGGGFACALFSFIEYSFKTSDVYAEAMNRVRHSEKVTRETGAPITPGWLVWGSINVSTNSGNADISIPIAGPKGKGSVHAVASKTEGAWHFEALEVKLRDGQEQVDLLQPQDTPVQP